MLKNTLVPKVFTTLKIASLTLIAAFSVVFFSYHLAYAKKVIPGVKVWQTPLGNKNQARVEAILAANFAQRQEQTIVLASEEKRFEFRPEDLGIDYDLENTVHSALSVGRSGNLLQDLKTEVYSWFKGVNIEPVLKVDQQKLNGVLATIANNIDDPSGNARFNLKEGGLIITPEKSGHVVAKEQLQENILALMKNGSTGTTKIPISDVEPTITTADLENIKPQIEKIIQNPITLTYQQRRFTPTATQILSFITFTKQDTVINIETNKVEMEKYIDGIANQIDREPTGDIFKLNGDRVVEFRVASEGLTLDQGQTLTLLSESLLGKQKEVQLPVSVAQPPHSANGYGIKELLGEGVSNFSGSAQGRINNIVTASNRLKGILIAPGETFSFNNSLGEVSAATGFDQAYIISQGRTILGTGGGVCQVSTTVFRAAFNSGLEIVKRTAHAYRVSYYEPPVGFDATVYAPSPDLVFKNDTPNYILIWSEVDLNNQNLYFRIYGTPDGRQTKMIGPFVSNETPPPAPLYQEDPTLPKGTTKQIDFAAWGADAVLRREVYRNGDTLHNDTFYSHFQPWQAVYLVGVGG